MNIPFASRPIRAALTWLCLLPASCATPEVNLESLLAEMTDFASIARWPEPEFTCRQASSYAEAVQPAPPFTLGTFTPRDGKFTLRLEVVGSNPAAKGATYLFGLDCLILETP